MGGQEAAELAAAGAEPEGRCGVHGTEGPERAEEGPGRADPGPAGRELAEDGAGDALRTDGWRSEGGRTLGTAQAALSSWVLPLREWASEKGEPGREVSREGAAASGEGAGRGRR